MDADRVQRWSGELGDRRVAEALVAARDATVAPVCDELAREHLQAVLAEQARPTTDRGEPAVPTLSAYRRARRLPTPRATSAAAAVLVLVLAVAGSLPEPAQRLVADLAGAVGVELPRPEPAADGDGDALAPDPADADLIGSLPRAPEDTAAANDATVSPTAQPTGLDAADDVRGAGAARDAGRSVLVPGLPDEAPGSASGRSDAAPGRGDDVPGHGEQAPGRADDQAGGHGDDARGHADEAPGHSKDAPGSSPDRSDGHPGPDAPQDVSQDPPAQRDDPDDGSEAAPGGPQDLPGRSGDTPRWAGSASFGTAGVTDDPGEAGGHSDDEESDDRDSGGT